MDIIDDAQRYNEHHQEVSLKNQAARLLPDQQPGFANFDGIHCVDCEDEIPLQRRQWKRCRCTPCEERREHVDRLRRHNIPLDTGSAGV